LILPPAIKLGNLSIDFKSWSEATLWATWRWKLDPFRSSTKQAAQSSALCLAYQRSPMPEEPFPDGTLVTERPFSYFVWRIYRCTDGNTVWRLVRRKSEEVVMQFRVSPRYDNITLEHDASTTSGATAFEYLAQIMPGVFLTHRILPFHGVLMEHQGRGIIISADSGVGKTTHARLWRDHRNALIINGDRAVCRKADGVWTGFGIPWSGSSGEQINRSVPLRAFVALERGEVNEAHRIGGMEAFSAMLPHVQCPNWDRELVGTAMELMDDFLQEIPVIRLRCRPDAESVSVLEAALQTL